MCLLFLVRPTRGRSMGDVLSPQSFGLRPPTGGYDSSDLLRRSQMTYICEMDPSYHLLCGGYKRCVSAIWILRITSSAEVTNDVYPQYGSFVSPPAEVTNDVYPQYESFVSPPAEVTNDVYSQYESFVSPPAEVTNDVYPQYGSFVSPPLRRF